MTQVTDTPTEELDNEDNVVVETGNGEPNPLEMSDEDFLNAPAPVVAAATKVEKPEGDKDGEDTVEGSETNPNPGDKPVVADGVKPEAKTGEGTKDKPAATGTEKDPKAGEKTEQTPEKPGTTAEIDYAAAGKALLAPFKANGRDVRVDSVEDARALMQMGANYNKKMAGLKPVMRIAKLLENHGLMDEEKLGFLIDLSKKDPKAINKLVKESGINPIEIDPEKAGEYQPTPRTVDDREVDLDTVLDDIKDSSSYTRTLSVAQAWDKDSKKVIGDQPALLKVINSHIETGVYDLINAEVERQRTLGRLQGVSDIAAYRQVGDAIQARGGFNHLFKPDGDDQGKASEAGKVVEPKPKKAEEDARNDKRRALGSPKPAVTATTPAKDFNPLAMSDEEFAKQAIPKFR